MTTPYERPELVELGVLSMDTLSASSSKGAPANPKGDENAEDDS